VKHWQAIASRTHSEIALQLLSIGIARLSVHPRSPNTSHQKRSHLTVENIVSAIASFNNTQHRTSTQTMSDRYL
jgi:hypothetical protein